MLKGLSLLFFNILVSLQILNAQEYLSTKVFDPELKTVQLYVNSINSQAYASLNPAVLSLRGNESLVLEFDDLRASYRQFHVKIVHCNLDWTPSKLRDLEYLTDYNDFIINDYEVSQGTKIPYFHYGFQVPRVTQSGNYVLELYENNTNGALRAQLRFSVVDAQLAIFAKVIRPQDPSAWRTHQQVDFEVNYGSYLLRDPRNELIVQIRKNFQDESTKSGFRPSSINAAQSKLSYRFFDNENLFLAGNEFRQLDIRSTYTRGENVEDVQQAYEDQVFMKTQLKRSDKTYLDKVDLNGRYVIETLEDAHPSISADYVHVNVGFKSVILPPNQLLCMLGAFNAYNCTAQNALQFSPEYGGYTGEMLLKQGVYDYQFGIKEPGFPIDYSLIEGDFTDTGNSYEIFIYHKPPAAKSERLVGYALINDSKRN